MPYCTGSDYVFLPGLQEFSKIKCLQCEQEDCFQYSNTINCSELLGFVVSYMLWPMGIGAVKQPGQTSYEV